MDDDSSGWEQAGDAGAGTAAASAAAATTATRSSARERGPSSKMNYACEACRLAKVKCQPGPTDAAGICKRCSEFKRECIFRTGPRTRRSKYSQAATAPLPPPPGPSKTFSINFDMPAEEKPDSQFELLRAIHERSQFNIHDSSDEEEEGGPGGGRWQDPGTRQQQPPLLSGVAAPATFSFADMSTKPRQRADTESSAAAAISSTGSGAGEPKTAKLQSMGSLAIKPQFNLESATRLLDHFRSMLVHCPVFVLPENADVRSMAREYPFVLLAILAVSSCTTSLQGYSLYDEEFRKVLGLKFVAGGERSLELLQGLLVYCAWYPFHLRPKSKHGTQYLRMTVDIVRDLELDQEDGMQMAAEDKLASIRAFLACAYLENISSAAWYKPPAFTLSTWWTKCGNILEQSSTLYQDHVLVALSRLQQIGNEMYSQFCTLHKSAHQDDNQRELIRLGLISRLQGIKNRMPSQYATATSVVLCSIFSDIYAVAGIAMKAPSVAFKASNYQIVAAHELLNICHTVRSFLDFLVGLKSEEISSLSSADLSRIILVLIVASRLSFPMPRLCPDLDYLQAREILRYDEYLEKLSATPTSDGIEDTSEDIDRSDATSGKKRKSKQNASESLNVNKTDLASALRVIIRSLRKVYANKIASHDKRRNAAGAAAAAHMADWAAAHPDYQQRKGFVRMGCPMIDGTLDSYIDSWGGQPDQQYSSRFYQVQQHPPHHQHQQQHPYSQQQQMPLSQGEAPGFYGSNDTTSNDSSTLLSSNYATSHSGQSSMVGVMMPHSSTSSSSDPSAVMSDGGAFGRSAAAGAPASGVEGTGRDANGAATAAAVAAPPPVVFQDLWDAMTIGWADTDMVDVVGVLQPQGEEEREPPASGQS
ncbi:hypothetical protein Micbo1qcDRAFT_231460 [Microdochium bolleyi]|uniref:Zn(2)-C6 fungal-type domain-containing protein n=1 Tax=Microdochium bolleyi TaxID=196109 RepID=A0A136J9I3_9PEZI|nr:hypothetical protein Micbo1qcDRAFT_231460 [Microdochium bolleyi]